MYFLKFNKLHFKYGLIKIATICFKIDAYNMLKLYEIGMSEISQ